MRDLEHLNLASLKERGWTPALVKEFLGEPDKTKVNPFYKSAAPQKLYRVDRVREIEQRAAFLEKKAVATQRSRAALARAEVARQALLAEVLPNVRVRRLKLNELRRRALASKKERDEFHGDFGGNPANAEERHIHRWMVNFARHELSNYDEVREKYAGKVGVHDAAEAVRSAVLAKIAVFWPELQEACRLAERNEEDLFY